MFTQMKNLDSAFRYVRGFSMILVLGAVLISIYSLYKSYQEARLARSTIYILANGKALEVFASDRKDNILVEARDQIKTFHQFFFNQDPDEKVIRRNISKALWLADGSAKRQYDNLKESGYYNNLVAGNISQEIEVDSVFVSLDTAPYYFKCFATERLIRSTSTVVRNLLTEGYLRTVSRSDNNPHGFLIEKWSILENKDLKVTTR